MWDLTHPFETGMPTYPGDPVVETWPSATLREDGYRVTAFGLSTHSGTHVDAPAHTEPDGRTLCDFPVERFRMDAHLVDCDGVGPDDPVDVEHVPETDADALVFHTGWHEHWGDDRYFDYPYLTPAAAERCADLGCDVAIDTPSVDPMNGDMLAHHELLRNDCLVVENVTDLADLPERFVLRAYPLALRDADGAPVRAIAEPH